MPIITCSYFEIVTISDNVLKSNFGSSWTPTYMDITLYLMQLSIEIKNSLYEDENGNIQSFLNLL